MLDTIKDSYAETIASALPLHRVFIALFGFLCSITVANKTHKSIVESILRIEFQSISTSTGKLLEKATLFDCFWGLVLCLITLVAYHSIAQLSFLLINKSINFDNKIRDRIKEFEWLKNLKNSDRTRAIERIELAKSNALKRIRNLGTLIELSIAISISLLASSYWGNLLDGLVGASAMLIAILIQAYFMHFFFSTYLGPALQEAIINGSQDVIRPM